MVKVLEKALSAGYESDLERYRREADAIAALSPRFEAMDDHELAGMTAELKERLAAGEKRTDIRADAFATVREASWRVLGKRHYPVQLIGGLVLDEGRVAEMRTGEGKTLVAALAAYLNALDGKGVHVVTVNEYLAERDSEEIGKVLSFLGMTCGLVKAGMDLRSRQDAYGCDVTYGTNSELGFDYLRDNMALHARDRVQRGFHYAIVDEADSVLIDEARTPLIISDHSETDAGLYTAFAEAVRGLVPDEDFVLDEPMHTVMATDEGIAKVERRLGRAGLFDSPDSASVGLLLQALRAEYLFHRDKDYAVVSGEVKIIDEYTGRILEGRRYSEGLHQALEAKEGVEIHPENATLATVTIQNFFRMYTKLSGMTGTALQVDSELRSTYHMPVQVVPTNKAPHRYDMPDTVFASERSKWDAVAREVEKRHAAMQPVLVGTNTVEDSELLSGLLERDGVPHTVLNAKNDSSEAAIIAEAGKPGAVTIATNMAGRGTDILLGGNPEAEAKELAEKAGLPEGSIPRDILAAAKEECQIQAAEVRLAGGLCVIGTSHSGSRRVDDQLRGRAGRQGDVGMTIFYVSLDDDLMRLNARRETAAWKKAHRRQAVSAMPIKPSLVHDLIEDAQVRSEQDAAEERKRILDYDDVIDAQRKAIYARRNELLDGCDVEPLVAHAIEQCVSRGEEMARDVEGANVWLASFGVEDADGLRDLLSGAVDVLKEFYPDGVFEDLTRRTMIACMDLRWREHISSLDYLRTGIGLRSYAQRDPLVEFRRDASDAFETIVRTIDEDFLRSLIQIAFEAQMKADEAGENA